MNINAYTGFLGRDFDIIDAGNTTIAKNVLAVRRDFKDKQTGQYETDWIPLTAFGKTAEIMIQHLSKGSKIEVVGKLQTNNYTDKDGNKRTSYDVIVNMFGFLDSNNDKQGEQQRKQPNRKVVDDDPFEANDDSYQIDDSALPF